MNSLSLNVASLSLALMLTLAAGFGQQPAQATDALGLSGMLGGLGGLGGAVDTLVNPSAGNSLVGGALGAIPNVLNAATGVVGGITAPVMGALGSMSGGILGQSGLSNMLSNTIGGTFGGGKDGIVGNTMQLAQGALNGVTTGIANGITGLTQADDTSPLFGSQLRNNFKREAIAEGGALMAAAGNMAANRAAVNGLAAGATAANRFASSGVNFGRAGAAAAAGSMAAEQMAANSGYAGASMAAGQMAAGQMAAGQMAAGQMAAGHMAAHSGYAAANMAQQANELVVNSALQGPVVAAGAAAAAAASQRAAEVAEEAMIAGATSGATGGALSGLAEAVNSGAAMAENAILHHGAAAAESLASNQAALVAANSVPGGRQALAMGAINNAQAESAAAGAEMAAHGARNSHSASIASNAYRQAKLASARDRVDIAGTIQNSARISDAAIATHDAATKAEDSLLGSELAVDSASTVLDSDSAYIPPVTNSLLRSLPYGRLGLRNIIPKPLTHPSVMLPDVWLNGVPVNYFNVPLRMLPYGIGPAASVNSVAASGAAMANGAIINAQPYIANNGLLLDALFFDPYYAYLAGANLHGAVGSSLAPILASGQLEAQDEVAVANSLNIRQLNGAGMGTTYQGYGRLNRVPLLTGSVSDITLMPTTTIGTTYPIGSALVIEPRDSYFQDYTDNASSRQNFDERQQ